MKILFFNKLRLINEEINEVFFSNWSYTLSPIIVPNWNVSYSVNQSFSLRPFPFELFGIPDQHSPLISVEDWVPEMQLNICRRIINRQYIHAVLCRRWPLHFCSWSKQLLLLSCGRRISPPPPRWLIILVPGQRRWCCCRDNNSINLVIFSFSFL